MFTVGGTGAITYLFGGGCNSEFCYLSVLDAETGKELARFSNRYFHDLGTGAVNHGSNLANMALYRADLSVYMGKKVKIRVADNATADRGVMFVDDFVAYYENESDVPADAFEARDFIENYRKEANYS